jgi:DNA-binding beta-propeller fold protein YncE
MFISDDDKFKVYVVDPTAPETKISEFQTLPLGGDDPEDVAVDPAHHHLFIANGEQLGHLKIIETDYQGSQVYSTINLPSVITDLEALAYDPREDVFYVGGGFSDNVWKVDRNGTILQTIDVLHGYYHPTYNTRVNVKDIELAPASDGSGETHLYVADFGSDKVTDGRIFEIDPGDSPHSGWILQA